MPYIQIEYIFANGDIRVEKCFSLRYGKKAERGENVKATSETQKEINRKRAEQGRNDLIVNNFNEGDLWVTLTYPAELRPAEFSDAHKLLMKFLKKIKRKFPSVKYMAKTETTVRGNHHHHLFFSWGDTVIKRTVTDAKTKKKIVYCSEPETGELLAMWREFIGAAAQSGGGYEREIYNISNGDLIAYFEKQAHTGNDDAERLPVKYSHSRNLKKPKVVRRVISNKNWRRTPRPRKGYEVTDLWNGVDAVGFEKQTYVLRKRC